MFERFTEKARDSLFWAALAARKEQAQAIDLIHLLAGVHRAMPEMLEGADLAAAGLQFPSLDDDIEEPAGDIPFSWKGRRALIAASEPARRFGSEMVGPVHLLWAIFQGDNKLREQLERAHLTTDKLEELCAKQREKRLEEPVIPLVSPASRSGIGYDLHRLEPGRKMILGGVEIPFDRGPAGHSDGDVLSHAICDALLGAGGLGDIGTHFPDTDPKWKGASSLLFLEHTRALLDERGLRIAHIDAVVIAERPRLSPHFPAMRVALAKALDIAPDQINLKAKTHEGMGELGRSEAIAAQAIATLQS